MDLSTLQAAEPDLLQQAAARMRSAATRLQQLLAEFSRDTGKLFAEPDAWTGSGASAASSSLSVLASHFSAMVADLTAAADVYTGGAEGVSGAQALLRSAQHLAAGNGLTIRPDGTVTWAMPLPGVLGEAVDDIRSLFTGLPAAAGQVSDLVASALRLAAETDGEVSALLARLPGSAAVVRAAEALPSRIAGQMPPPAGMSPAQASAWWKALGSAAQQQLIRRYPATIGSMNGLPATARDQANRLALREDQDSLERQLTRLEANVPPATIDEGRFGTRGSPAYDTWQASIASIRSQLNDISVLEQGLAMGGHNGLPHAYLLGFSTSGIGRAIVAFGDPDTAASTVTYVPGTGSTLTASGRDLANTAALWTQAHKLDPGQSVSSVYWLGYNAPGFNGNILADLHVAGTKDAVTGGQALAAFQAGLTAAHAPGVPDRAVLLGHSYGTLVIGEAAAHDGVRPSDVIFVGSPGAGVSKASQLGIPASHVWAGANVNDPIPDIPPDAFAQFPNVVSGAVVGAVGGFIFHGPGGVASGAEQGAFAPLQAAHAQNPDASFYGTNPATPAFGGQVFNANSVPGEPSTFNESYFLSFHAHDTYWNPGSSSLGNMAAIVTGNYGLVTPATAS
jgi:uncharacterized protein YukE